MKTAELAKNSESIVTNRHTGVRFYRVTSVQTNRATSVSEARQDIAQYIDWYNGQRGHSSIEGKTPEQFYLSGLPKMKEAA